MAAAAAQTSTAVIAELKEGEHKPVAETITLKLVPRRKKKEERVRWSEDVEEINEFSGKFKSKKCCQFHKRRAFGDWSDEDDSDAECDCNNPGDPQGPPQPSQPV